MQIMGTKLSVDRVRVAVDRDTGVTPEIMGMKPPTAEYQDARCGTAAGQWLGRSGITARLSATGLAWRARGVMSLPSGHAR
jgi:hypothetical protein